MTIDQLLESVDLKFEPRFVTKSASGLVEFWEFKPSKVANGTWCSPGWTTTYMVVQRYKQVANNTARMCAYCQPHIGSMRCCILPDTRRSIGVFGGVLV